MALLLLALVDGAFSGDWTKYGLISYGVEDYLKAVAGTVLFGAFRGGELTISQHTPSPPPRPITPTDSHTPWPDPHPITPQCPLSILFSAHIHHQPNRTINNNTTPTLGICLLTHGTSTTIN